MVACNIDAFGASYYNTEYDIASPCTTLQHRIRHCISGYDIASLISGYDITTPGTTLHLRVRYCISGYGIASPGMRLHLRVRHCIFGYDIVSPGTTLHNTENDIAQYGTRHNKDTVLLFCQQYPSIFNSLVHVVQSTTLQRQITPCELTLARPGARLWFTFPSYIKLSKMSKKEEEPLYRIKENEELILEELPGKENEAKPRQDNGPGSPLIR